NDYFAKALSEILFPWLKMFNESPNFSTLNDVNPSFALIFELKKIKVEAIYLLLKDMALSPDMPGGSNAMKHMFTFALRS
ncbi:unnamed protein product, partial [Brassica rapa subsp. trilocularis]